MSASPTQSSSMVALPVVSIYLPQRYMSQGQRRQRVRDSGGVRYRYTATTSYLVSILALHVSRAATPTPLLIHILFLSRRHIYQGQRRQRLVRYRYTAANLMHFPRALPLLIHINSLYLSRRCMYGASSKKNTVSEK